MSLTSGSIHIVIHFAPAQWWQILAILGPYAVLLIAEIWWCIELIRIRRRNAAELPGLSRREE